MKFTGHGAVLNPSETRQVAVWAWEAHQRTHETCPADTAHADPVLCDCFQQLAPVVRNFVYRGAQASRGSASDEEARK